MGKPFFAGVGQAPEPRDGCQVSTVPGQRSGLLLFPLGGREGRATSPTGRISVEVRPVEGLIDQAGGIAFGIQNIGNYFVFRLNSLEDNLILFEYVNSRRVERKSVARTLKAGQWYQLKIDDH